MISNEEYKLLLVPTGFSFKWNKKHKIYYCPEAWHSQKFKFFGLYNQKSVRSVSVIETTILASYDAATDKLTIDSSGHTDEQISRLKKGLHELEEDFSDFKYYILPEDGLYETDFRKVSHGGIQGYRYHDLRDYLPHLNNDAFSDTKFVAEELKKETWK